MIRMYDLIEKKKSGELLTEEEISQMIEQYVADKIPDYQMAAMLMAIYFQGLSDEELSALTLAMAHSGEMIDLSSIPGTKVDKHSTGGVGDKTTLIVGPMVAACGVKVAKMAGRGLGFTGGTIDKLESIPGFQTTLSKEQFFEIVRTVGVSVMGQSENITPADKKLYALRDVTATVDSIPLIAASVMSKKLASGSDSILLDVTTGSGAFMKKKEDAISLAEKMVAIGEHAGRETVAVITNMDTPLGTTIGNALEIEEVVEILKGDGPKDLLEVCIELAGNMLYLAKKAEKKASDGKEVCHKDEKVLLEQCKQQVENTIRDQSAYRKMLEMVKAQGGDISVLENTKLLPRADYYYDIVAGKSGTIVHIDTEKCGIASVLLGAGREKKESEIDMAAGIRLYKKVGDIVETGDTIATLYSNHDSGFKEAEKVINEAYQIEKQEISQEKLILARVTKDGVE